MLKSILEADVTKDFCSTIQKLVKDHLAFLDKEFSKINKNIKDMKCVFQFGDITTKEFDIKITAVGGSLAILGVIENLSDYFEIDRCNDHDKEITAEKIDRMFDDITVDQEAKFDCDANFTFFYNEIDYMPEKLEFEIYVDFNKIFKDWKC